MRNLIWSGTALVLVIGAGFFMTARHAARHPDSFVARCSMRIYHLCDTLLAPRTGMRPAEEIAQAPQAAPALGAVRGLAQAIPDAEVIEPIVVEPTDQEPPLAIPRLSPEIAAAIERLRAEEESEEPPQAFDGPGHALRMPYADEEVEVLPAPTPDPMAGGVEIDMHLPEWRGSFLLPSSCWQTLFDRFMEAFRRQGHADQGEESAGEGAPENES